MAQRGMEGTVDPIIVHIRTNIAAALNAVSADRVTVNQNQVSLPPFQEYHIYAKSQDLRTPSCYVLGDTIDWAKDRGQNAIASRNYISVSAVIDDRTADLLTRSCWRYHDALHKVLDRAALVSGDGKVKNIVKVVSSSFTDAFQVKSQNGNIFRKEVMLSLEVEHFENE
jgi:hypothetical protein